MSALLAWFRRKLNVHEPSPLRSRINAVSRTAQGQIRKQAGKPFSRGVHFYDPVQLIRREVYFLERMRGRRAPLVLDRGDDWFVMSDCGLPVTRESLPADWREQIEDIARALDDAQIIHRDIKPGNLLVLDQKLWLIDFGWSLSRGEAPYVCPRDLVKDLPKALIYDNRAALNWIVSTYAV